MPRPRSPNRDKAYEIFKKHNGNIENRRIAEQLGEDEKLIATWKFRDGWLKKNNDVHQTSDVHQKSNERRTSKPGKNKSTNNAGKNSVQKSEAKKGSGTPDKSNTQNPKARYGNKNAVGNKGGLGGPLRNKYAIKTHEYATVFFSADIIDEEERAILDADYDKYAQQLILIDTLKIREKRILQEIRKVKETPGGMVIDSVTKQKGSTTTSYTNRNKAKESWEGNSITEAVDTATHVAEPELKRRMQLEAALDRVQGRLQRALEVWHKMEMDDENLAISLEKLELHRQRISGQIDLDQLIDDDDLGLDFDE